MGQQTDDFASGSASTIGDYRAPFPKILQAYSNNLGKNGFLDLPSFNELFGSYRDVANQEANRQSAQITESLGSMGAGRYSSAGLNAQAQLRKDTSLALANKAAEYQTALRGQQFNEVQGIGGLQFGSNEAAQNRLWSDFLRRTSPPPLLDYLTSQSQGYGLPATVVA